MDKIPYTTLHPATYYTTPEWHYTGNMTGQLHDGIFNYNFQ